MQTQKFLVSFLIIFSFTKIFASSADCAEAIINLSSLLSNLKNNVDTSQLLSLPLFAYSGKYFNDFGDYEKCTILQNTSYFTMYITQRASTKRTYVVGICGPKNCSGDDYNSRSIQAKAHQIILTASELYGYNLYQLLSEHNIYTTDLAPPTDENSLPLLPVLVIVMVPLLLTLFSTIYKFFLPKNSKKLLESILEAWEVQSNFKKLFRKHSGANYDSTLDVLDGLRVTTSLWIFSIHFLLIRCMVAALPYEQSGDGNSYSIIQGYFYLIYYSVDAFFFIGGLLAAYSISTKLKEQKLTISTYLSIISHRIIRILPSYTVTVLAHWIPSYLRLSGPVWIMYLEILRDCKENWWKNLIFMNNWLNRSPDNGLGCAVHGWYLSNDLQIYLLAPILVWLYFKNHRICIAVTAGLILGSIFLGILLSPHYRLYASVFSDIQPGWVKYIYMNTGLRIAPYLIGMMLGLAYRSNKMGSHRIQTVARKVQSSQCLSWALEIVGFTIIASTISIYLLLARNETIYPMWIVSAFKSCNRTVLGLGFALFVIPSLCGANAFAKRLFGSSIFAPFSVLSFNFYLLQYGLMIVIVFSEHATFVLTIFNLTYYFCLWLGISLLLALVVFLTVEAPVIQLENMVRGGSMKGKTE